MGSDAGRMNRAGLPATTTAGATDRVTTLQAPTIAPGPIDTPGIRKARAPMKVAEPIVIGAVCKGLLGRLRSWVPAHM